MKRELRIIIDLACGFAACLFIATIAFWIRGYWIIDRYCWESPSWAVIVETGGGQFRFEHTRPADGVAYARPTRLPHQTDRADGPLRLCERAPGSEVHVDAYGFWIVTGERWGDEHHALFTPAWFVAVLTCSLPTARLIRLRYRRRSAGPGFDVRQARVNS